QPSWPEPPPVKDPVPAWSEPPASSYSDAWSNLNSPAPWPQQADTSRPGDPLDGTMTMNRVPDLQPAPVDPDAAILGSYGPGGLDDHPGRARSSAAAADEHTMMYGRASLTGSGANPVPSHSDTYGGPGRSDRYGGADGHAGSGGMDGYSSPGGGGSGRTDAYGSGGSGGSGGMDGYGANRYGNPGGSDGYGGQGVADPGARNGYPGAGGPEGYAGPGARAAHAGAGVEAPAGPGGGGPGGSGGLGGSGGSGSHGGSGGPGGVPGGPYGPGGSGGSHGPGGPGGPGHGGRGGADGPYGPSGPDGPYGPGGHGGADGPYGPGGPGGADGPYGPGGQGGADGPYGPGGPGGHGGPGGADGPYGPGGHGGTDGPYGGADGPYGPSGPGGPAGHGHGGPGTEQGRPGANLSRDPSDPDRPFVTAGQISGSRTPPPERQQELWNTVFGDNYQAMGEPESLDEPGKPLWIYALASSAAVALVIALLWAFIAGPLASEDPGKSAAQATPSQSAPATPRKTSVTIGRLPAYKGNASPVTGTVQDPQAGIQVPRLGGTWRLDERPTVKGTYGYDTRQYAMVGDDLAAQVLTGPLPAKLAGRYTSPDDLEPVIKAVVVDARKRLYADGNKVRKIAQQSLKVGDSTGRLIAYSLTSPTEKATVVAAAINTGGDVPAIVFMSVPAEGKALLPDVNTVVKRLRLISQG
ncbi:hypothetical protein OUY24_35060, partial [Nonomuraea ferruginea]|nr:hypothetical protein [Nonomuraea ferruginea]